MSKSDERINKLVSEVDFYIFDDYFMSLAMAVAENVPLDSEDIKTLHKIIDKGKNFGTYGYSSQNYKKELESKQSNQ